MTTDESLLIARRLLRFRALVFVVALMAGCSGGQQADEPPDGLQEGGEVPLPQSTAPPSGARYITGLVFEDRNRNGNYDTGDVRMAQQAVVLSDPSGERRLATATTGADGAFRFENLAPGDYRLTMQVPEGFSGANDRSFVLTVPKEAPPAEVQFGLVRR